MEPHYQIEFKNGDRTKRMTREKFFSWVSWYRSQGILTEVYYEDAHYTYWATVAL